MLNPSVQIRNHLSLSVPRKDIPYEIFKRDDLQIEEIVAWEYLIKWGTEQTPGLGSLKNNRVKWNDNNYKDFKPIYSFIRFVEISAADFFDKVCPYKAIIPHHIYEEVAEFYYKNTLPKTSTLPPRCGKVQIRSKLIKPNLVNIIRMFLRRKQKPLKWLRRN